MPDPRELVKAADRLLSGRDGPASDACVRRAISTAYYALFHDVARTAADSFVGQDRRGTPGYTIIYRALSHTRMKTVFDEIDRDQLRRKYESALFTRSEADSLIFDVEMSLGTFERINPNERFDVLALLLVAARD